MTVITWAGPSRFATSPLVTVEEIRAARGNGARIRPSGRAKLGPGTAGYAISALLTNVDAYESSREPDRRRELQLIAVNWAEVTAIATSILAIGLLGAFAAAVFAAQQAREARRSREAQMAAEFFRRWNEDALVEARRLVGRFKTPQELRDAFVAYVADDAPQAYILYRELDYFEQLAALERRGAFDFELIKLLLGRTLIDRWEMWKPAIEQAHGPGVYPLFEGLVEKLRRTLKDQAAPYA